MKIFQQAQPPEKSYWRGKSLEIRQTWTENFYYLYPQVSQILDDFVEKLDHCERTKKCRAMLVIGGTGSGKTTLTGQMREYAHHRYQRIDEEKTICPVIQFSIPDPCTPFEICISILKALGEEQPRARKNKADTIKAAEKLLGDCEVKLVLLDNVQDIPERRGKRGIELAGARLRNLIDSSSALWVFMGTSDARKVINSDRQLIRRVAYKRQLTYFGIKTNVEKASFKRLLIEIDKWLPLAEPSCLAVAKTSSSMWLATEGIFDRIIQLVDRAWFEAFKAMRETMEIADLENAFGYVYGDESESSNPFSKGFVIRKLKNKDEPFEFLNGDQE